MKAITNIQRISGNMDYIFTKANNVFFDGELPKPMFTCSPTKGSYGHMSVGNFWCDRQGNGLKELNLNPGFLDRPLENIVATIIHEMVHMYCGIHGIKDTSGYYHNKKFKEEAEKRSLSIGHSSKYGWTLTNPTDDTINFIIENEISDFDITRNIIFNIPTIGKPINTGTSGMYEAEKGKTKKPSSTRKYQCPICKNSVRATKNVNILCIDCNEKMIIV